jgi:hypothetical protein
LTSSLKQWFNNAYNRLYFIVNILKRKGKMAAIGSDITQRLAKQIQVLRDHILALEMSGADAKQIKGQQEKLALLQSILSPGAATPIVTPTPKSDATAAPTAPVSGPAEREHKVVRFSRPEPNAAKIARKKDFLYLLITTDPEYSIKHQKLINERKASGEGLTAETKHFCRVMIDNGTALCLAIKGKETNCENVMNTTCRVLKDMGLFEKFWDSSFDPKDIPEDKIPSHTKKIMKRLAGAQLKR